LFWRGEVLVIKRNRGRLIPGQSLFGTASHTLAAGAAESVINHRDLYSLLFLHFDTAMVADFFTVSAACTLILVDVDHLIFPDLIDIQLLSIPILFNVRCCKVSDPKMIFFNEPIL
jgi:hypothetical protein